jgi:hypothetical protein
MANIGKVPIHTVMADTERKDGKTQELRKGHTNEVLLSHSKGKQGNPPLDDGAQRARNCRDVGISSRILMQMDHRHRKAGIPK